MTDCGRKSPPAPNPGTVVVGPESPRLSRVEEGGSDKTWPRAEVHKRKDEAGKGAEVHKRKDEAGKGAEAHKRKDEAGKGAEAHKRKDEARKAARTVFFTTTVVA